MQQKGFWVVEERTEWWFQLDAENLDELAERVDSVARAAVLFWKEIPPSQEERAIILKLIRAVRSEKARKLLADLL
jgi:hypothetical protein